MRNIVPTSFYKKPKHVLIFFFIIILFWHIGIMPAIDFGTDEAHYALYAMHLSIGYFDHPPMVGWLLSPLAILPFDITSRILALLYICIIIGLIYTYTYKTFTNHAISALAVVIFSSQPIIQIVAFAVLPDTPLTIGVLLLAFAFPPAKKTIKLTFFQALLLGIILGFCGLSKYIAIFLPIAMFANKHILKWAKQPLWYVSGIIALVIIAPYLYFLYTTDFASFTYHINRLQNDSFSFTQLLTMLVTMFISYGPIAIIGGAMALYRYRKNIGWIGIYIILLTIFILFGAKDNIILPHWGMSIFALLAPYTAHYLYTHTTTALQRVFFRLFLYILAGIQMLLLLTTVTIVSLVAFSPPKLYADVPLIPSASKQLKGWYDLAHWSTKLINQYQADILLTRNWTKVSRLAWYMHPQAVLPYFEKNQQFGWWFGTRDQHNTAIFITIDNQELPQSAPCSYIQSYQNAYHDADAYYCEFNQP